MSKLVYSTIIFTFVLSSCASINPDNDSPIMVHLNDTLKSSYSVDNVKIESEYVLVDSIPVIGEIKDQIQIGNKCYVLDNNKTIFCIDLDNGKMISHKKQIGHSRQELIMPSALSTDSSFIYVYDSGTNRIVVFDKNLSYKDSKKMPCGFESFTKVEGGYLCYSEYRPMIHFITNDGKLVYSRSMADYVVNIGSEGNVFTRDEKNNIYIKAEYSDTIFQWIEGKCVPRYIISLGKKRVPGDIKTSADMWARHLTFPMDFFVNREGIILSYVEGREKIYICYYKETGEFTKPSIDLMKNAPFIPQWKTGDCYYTFANKELTKLLFKRIKKNIDKAAILKYKLVL